MTVLDSLIRVADFRLERAEQQRAFITMRIERLRQSKAVVEENLRELQQQYGQAVQDGGGILQAHRLVGWRQIWLEAQERRKLTLSIDEQLSSLLEQKAGLDLQVREFWARKASLQKAREVQALVRRADMARAEFSRADDSWMQSQSSRMKGQK